MKFTKTNKLKIKELEVFKPFLTNRKQFLLIDSSHT